MKPNFAIIGAGAGGQSMAAILSEKGYRVRLQDIDSKRVDILNALDSIEVTGKIVARAKPEVITTSVEEVMDDADIIMITTTADAHEAVGKAIKPYIHDGQVIMLNPGQVGGALMMSRLLRDSDAPKKVLVAESLDLMYSCRLEKPGRVFHSGTKSNILTATVPANDINSFMEIMKPIFPCLTAAESVLYTSLDCGGAILHVIPTLMNINLMDREINYDYYMEGITPNIAKLMEDADMEREQVCAALHAELPSLQKWMEDCYHIEGNNLYNCIQKNESYVGVKCPTNLKHRFITEEILTGFVPIASIAKELGLKTPIIDAFILLAHSFTGIDYWTAGRTAKKLGFSGMTAEDMRNFISK